MKAFAVIGANFGDEGKGAAVDALAARFDYPLVVRFNGGAQAGHTVVTPEGKRHVFSHFGAGTFASAPTFLSRFFVLNPELFCKEREELRALGLHPRAIADPDALITVPSDVWTNRWLEESRGADRHGSCGIGFGETIERFKKAQLALRVRDLYRPDEAQIARVVFASIDWAEKRLQGFGLLTEERKQVLRSTDHLRSYTEKLLIMSGNLSYLTLQQAKRNRTLIFEGAQGLMLDQYSPYFPNVTRSSTGLLNITRLLRGVSDITKLDVYYMTRTYMTRHGAGPLPGETGTLAHPADETNVENGWQGKLRCAPFNAELTKRFINHDLLAAGGVPWVTVTPMLGVSCLDQIPAGQGIADIGLPVGMMADGPTRTHRRFSAYASVS